ncbi:MAG TPA: hypothetical protein VHI52_13825 [Verrucomicrobiae bacterium]|nr:hypothetical protein [Verrucomicrobiae bacterium]
MTHKIKSSVSAYTLAHLALTFAIAAEVLLLGLATRFLLPACRRLILLSGLSVNDAYGFMPGGALMSRLLGMARAELPWLALVFVSGCLVIGWLLRSESERSLRLAVMASISLVLFGVGVGVAALMVIPTIRAGERMSARFPEPVVACQIAALARLMSELELAVAKQDWPATHLISHEGGGAAENLILVGDSASAILTVNEQPRIDEVRSHLASIKLSMDEIWAASRRTGKRGEIEMAMQGLRTAYAALRAEIPPK